MMQSVVGVMQSVRSGSDAISSGKDAISSGSDAISSGSMQLIMDAYPTWMVWWEHCDNSVVIAAAQVS